MNSSNVDFLDPKMLRRKAEELLLQREVSCVATESDALRLLHELQVHQIELEMQNEELQQAYVRAETALKKYTMLYDFAPMGHFTLNIDGSIMDLNFTGAEILGDRRFSLINTNFKLFISAASLPTFNLFFESLFSGQCKQSCEVQLGYVHQPCSMVYMEGVVTGTDQFCLLSVVDVTKFSR